jgi:hypothetical protein
MPPAHLCQPHCPKPLGAKHQELLETAQALLSSDLVSVPGSHMSRLVFKELIVCVSEQRMSEHSKLRTPCAKGAPSETFADS